MKSGRKKIKILILVLISILIFNVNNAICAEQNYYNRSEENVKAIDETIYKIQESTFLQGIDWQVTNIVEGFNKINGFYYYFDKEKNTILSDIRKIIPTTNDYLIAVNRLKNVVTVYTKSQDGIYNLPVCQFLTIANKELTPKGVFFTYGKSDWYKMGETSFVRYATYVDGPIFFHSTSYEKKDVNTLKPGLYNNLGRGIGQSHGCIRLQCGDAYFIYENLPLGGPIFIYDSEIETSFLSKPTIKRFLGPNETKDPTAPKKAN